MKERPTFQRAWLTPRTVVPVIFGLVLWCYWPALQGGLVWDDAAHVTKTELRSWAGLGRIWSDIHATQQYYPLLHSAFWLEHRLWGDATLGYHLTNMLLHVTACVLLALVLRRLWEPARNAVRAAPVSAGNGGSPSVPEGTEWLAAMLFAVHPVCVESVAWISEQKNVLSLVFYLSAAFVYLGFDATRRARSYAFATVFFLLALGTKTVTATLPAALLVVLWWRNGSLRWRRDVGPLLPWFLAAAAAGSLTAWVERVLIGAHGASYDLSLGERVLLAGRVIWFYLGKLVWPADLMFVYPRWDVRAAAGGWFFWLTGAAAVTVGLWLLRRKTRGPLACWLFFIGSLFPALGFFNVYPFAFSYVADHFQYLACLGVIVLIAAALTRLPAELPPPLRFAGIGLCAALVGGLALLAHQQSRSYRDSVTLYRTTLAKNPDCWMAHNNLAMEIENEPEHVPEALAHYAEALRIKPDDSGVHNNLGNRLMMLGREAEAIAQFGEALRLDPTSLLPRLNLANALAKDPQRLAEAMGHYAEALRLDPENGLSHFSLAVTLATIDGRAAEAQAEFEATLRLLPDYAGAHAGLAELLARLPGRGAEAEAEYRATLELAPKDAKTHYNYAVWLESAPGRAAEAMAHYEEALRINPAYAQAHNNLAILFAQRRQFDLARVHWEAAVKAKPDYDDAIRNLRLLEKRTQK
jgi:Tfp pilus assembly protein PilF